LRKYNNNNNNKGLDIMEMLESIGVVGFVDSLEVIRGLQRQKSLSFPSNLLKTKGGRESLSQTSLFHAIHGQIPQGAHQADADALNLISIIGHKSLIKAFKRATPTPIAAIFEKVVKPPKTLRKRNPCPECGKKRHTAKNQCSLKKKKN